MRYSIAKIDDPFHLRITTSGDASGVRFQWIFTEVVGLLAELGRPPILLDERGSNLGQLDPWDTMVAYDFLMERTSSSHTSRSHFWQNPAETSWSRRDSEI